MFFREIKQPQMVPELNENICFLFWPNGSRTDSALTLCCSVLAETTCLSIPLGPQQKRYRTY